MSPPNSTESWRYHLRRGVSDVLFIIMLVLAFLLLLVLFGYHNTDPGWSTSGAAQETRHFFGILGAYTADALFSLLGYAAYLLPLGLGAISWQSMRRAQLDAELMGWKAFALVIAIVSLCGILSLHSTTVINSLAVTGGGIVGQKMTIELLRMWPVQLVMCIYTLLFFIGITLLLEMSWLRILEWVGQRGVNAYSWLWRKVDSHTGKPPQTPDAPKRSPFAPEPEVDADADSATAAGKTSALASASAALRDRLLATVTKYKARRAGKPRPQHTPVFQSSPAAFDATDEDDLPPFRAPPRHEANEAPQRSEPNISWAHYKAQIAPEPETTPPMDDDTGDYRPKSDYFARRQSEGLPLRDETPWPAAAANDAANDADLDVSDDDFEALDEEYDPPLRTRPNRLPNRATNRNCACA